GGKLNAYAKDAASRVPAVRHVIAAERSLAVAADTWWAADTGLQAADPKFSGPRTPHDIRPAFEEALANGDAQSWFSRGDYNRTVRGSHPLASTYYVAPTLHLGLAPLTAT